MVTDEAVLPSSFNNTSVKLLSYSLSLSSPSLPLLRYTRYLEPTTTRNSWLSTSSSRSFNP